MHPKAPVGISIALKHDYKLIKNADKFFSFRSHFSTPSLFLHFFNPKRWHLHLGQQPHFPTPCCEAMTMIAVNTAKDKTRGTILSALLASLSRASTVNGSNATIQELKNEKF